jgi:hypothetical protein
VNTQPNFHVDARGYTIKSGPDEIDRHIFHVLGMGFPISVVSRRMNMAMQSVANRVRWIRAHRWATFEGTKVLSEEERGRLLAFEQEQLDGNTEAVAS